MARDWPVKPERGLMIGYGRNYYTLAWLADQVREMAYLKLNTLHLHVADDEGFRIESERHQVGAALASRAGRQLSHHGDSRDRYALSYGVDSGGASRTSALRHAADGDIDLANPKSYALMRELLAEYLPLFPGPYWHIDGDECDYFGAYERFPPLQAYARRDYGAHRTRCAAMPNWRC